MFFFQYSNTPIIVPSQATVEYQPASFPGREGKSGYSPAPPLVSFVPYEKNPLFSGTGMDTWDENIRERGYILREENGYHLKMVTISGIRDTGKAGTP